MASALERRIRKLEAMVPEPPCPVHGKNGFALHCFQVGNEEDLRQYEEKRREIEQCRYCGNKNHLCVVFQLFGDADASPKPSPEGETFQFSFSLPNADQSVGNSARVKFLDLGKDNT